eukprot:TRINITY_DN4398_c0_g2_i1.p1 TRINITY_DN4398_c0_g2~~TRINITY_DN4398_c0_g2_i1.p1  ORF type:complete len:545 (+),score=138.43 TRINITY_DN4398_c0_g2_i1:124-1758(+)
MDPNLVDLDDLVAGKNDWLNIPTPIRLAFKYMFVQQKKMFDNMQGQAYTIQQMQLEEKHRDTLINELQERIDTLLKEGKEAAEKISRLEKQLQQAQAAIVVLQENRVVTEQRLEVLNQGAQEVQGTLQTKANLEDLQNIINVTQRLQQIKVDKNLLESRVSEVYKSISEQSDKLHTGLQQHDHVFQASLHALQESINGKLVLMASNADLELKASRSEVQGWLAQKSDRSDLKKLASELNTSKQEFDHLKKSHQFLFDALQNKADNGVVKQSLTEVRDELLQTLSHWHAEVNSNTDLINQSLGTKANIEDVEKLVSSRAGPEDLHNIVELLDVKADLVEVKELEEKLVRKEEFDRQVLQQAKINSVLCSEFSTARWIWKSGRIEKGYSVPWNHEVSNTDPSNFLWERNSTAVVSVAPGLYEICAAFFTTRPAKVTLFVNDIPVLSRESPPSTLLSMSAKKPGKADDKKAASKTAIVSASSVAASPASTLNTSSSALQAVPMAHPDGNVYAGLSFRDFLALPPRALISLTFTGEDGTQGFLGLRKL